MLQQDFFARIMWNVILGVMFASALSKMASYNNREVSPQKHGVMKAFGCVFAVLSCWLSVILVMGIREITFPTLMQSPDFPRYVGADTLRSSIPTPSQYGAIQCSIAIFDFMGLSAYFLLYKSSNSRWYVKIGKFVTGWLLMTCYALAAKVYTFYALAAQLYISLIIFVALWLIIVLRINFINKRKRRESLVISSDSNATSNVTAHSDNITAHSDVVERANKGDNFAPAESEVADSIQTKNMVESDLDVCKSELYTKYKEDAMCKTIYCKHCGKQIDVNSTFCRYCGTSVSTGRV